MQQKHQPRHWLPSPLTAASRVLTTLLSRSCTAAFVTPICIRRDWGFSEYPIVPGHEVIGRVVSVGDSVTKFKAGDLAGIGCMVDSCRECNPCQQGLEQYCEEGNVQTYNGHDRHDHQPTYGGYSQTIIASEAFVLHIPQGIDLKGAAPLLCAGITTWSPLRHWNIGKGSKVAVVGLGGLGHMAIKLAHGLGAEVTLFTRSPGKKRMLADLGPIISSTQRMRIRCSRWRISST
jgi:uncharacterized zinc-type alcohol dehydrogenase-like protein